jgi:hypothetical protein
MNKSEAKEILRNIADATYPGGTPLLPIEVREAINVAINDTKLPKDIDEAIRVYLVGVIFDNRVAESEVGVIKEHIAKAIKYGALWSEENAGGQDYVKM